MKEENYTWKPDELTNKNWVLNADGKELQLGHGHLYFLGQVDKIRNMKPIQITPQLLERVDGCHWLPKSKLYSFWSSPDGNNASLMGQMNKQGDYFGLSMNNGSAMYIKYLHVLQNLVGALSNYEVQLTLK